MTCRGYDPKAIKLGKPIQRLAATIRDDEARKHFLKMFVAIANSESKSVSRRGGNNE